MAIYALSPAGHVTGGPESMHQLVHKARTLGIEAYMHYWGGDGERTIPAAYDHYDIALADVIPDSQDSIIIVPETVPFLLKTPGSCRRVLWWLSVDNAITIGEQYRIYNVALNDGGTYDFTFDPRENFVHLTHSEYARRYLAMKGVVGIPLGDYISDKIVESCARLAGTTKLDQIAYNPKKGFKFTQALISAAAGRFKWVPIEKMTHEEVAETLSTSKLYIDFGEHPGQDHLPKEAALAGCCVLTGTRGAAANSADLPIPERFKLNEASPDSVQRALESIQAILANYAQLTPQFDSYRAWIGTHEELFVSQVEAIFGLNGALPPHVG